MDASRTFQIKPSYAKKFRPAVAQEIIRDVLQKHLEGLVYNPESTVQWTREIAEDVRKQLKGEEQFDSRYKFVVQVLVGEQRGQGFKLGCRCLWDTDTDAFAEEVYTTDSFFCVVTAYGLYHY